MSAATKPAPGAPGVRPTTPDAARLRDGLALAVGAAASVRAGRAAIAAKAAAGERAGEAALAAGLAAQVPPCRAPSG